MADDIQDVDRNIRNAVGDRVRGALALSGDYDTDVAKGAIKEFTPADVNYGKEGLSAAIKSKFGKQTQDEINKIKQLQRLNHPKEAFKSAMGAGNVAGNLNKFDKQREMAIRQRRLAEESQRASLLGSLLGVAGTIAGAAIAGPTGAVVGSQIGGGAAKMTQNKQSGME